MWRRSLAASAADTTIAPQPVTGMSQSYSDKGSATIRADRYVSMESGLP